MTKIIGRLNSVGYGKETTRGTAVGASIWVPWMEVEYDDVVELLDNEASIARLENTDAHALAFKSGEVKLKSKIKDKNIGYPLLALFGTVASVAKSAPNAAVYDHTFSVQQGVSHQSLTISFKGPNEDLAMANSVLSKFVISCKYGEYAMFETEFMGKPSASATQTVSIVQENDFFSKHATFKRAATQALLTAASAIAIREFKIEFDQKAFYEQVLGLNTPNDVLNQDWGVKGSVTLIHNDKTFNTLMTDATYQALRFDFQNTDVTIGTSANPGLQIDLHKVSILNYKRKQSLNNIVEESFDFIARYSLTDSKMVTAVLTNTQSSY